MTSRTDGALVFLAVLLLAACQAIQPSGPAPQPLSSTPVVQNGFPPSLKITLPDPAPMVGTLVTLRVESTPLDFPNWSTAEPSMASLSQDGTLQPHTAGTVVVSATRQGVTVRALLAITPDPPIAARLPKNPEHERLLPNGEVSWLRDTSSEPASAMLLVRQQIDHYEGLPVITRTDEQGVEMAIPKTETYGYFNPASVPPLQVFAWRLPEAMSDKPVWITRMDRNRRRLLKSDEVVEIIASSAPTPSPSADQPHTSPPCAPPAFPTAYYPCPTSSPSVH